MERINTEQFYAIAEFKKWNCSNSVWACKSAQTYYRRASAVGSLYTGDAIYAPSLLFSRAT